MSTTALQGASTAAARARDAGMTATSKADIFNLLSRMQTIANSATQAVIGHQTLQIQAYNPFYSLSGALPQAVRVVDVRDASGRSLDGPIPYESLKWLSMEWSRETGTEPKSFCVVGKDLLIIRPNLTIPANVTVYYAAVTNVLAVDKDLFQCPDEDVQMVIDPVEFLLDLKSRDLNNCKAIFDRWNAVIMGAKAENR